MSSIPILSWINRRGGYAEAQIGFGESLRIVPVNKFALELWHYQVGDQPTYLGTHIGLDEARKAARAWVGDSQ